jgi:hypothetical protein
MPSTSRKRRARNKKDLRALFKASKNVQEKVDGDIVEQFIKSIKFVDGHVAHMHYGVLQKALSKADFLKVLSWVGVSPKKFDDLKDSTCGGLGGLTLTCVYQPGSYCDTQFCWG